MSVPTHHRPFSLDDAKAGAPVGTTAGNSIRFVAYAEEADPSCCIIVIEQRNNLIGTRRKTGRVNEVGAPDNPYDLVMLPLGLIDGKPVFIGDEIRDRWDNTAHAHVGMGFDPKHWFWPAPAKVYPETQMTTDYVFDNTGISVSNATLRDIANAALRHAIDAGQLVEPSDRVERDMAIAQAVRKVFKRLLVGMPSYNETMVFNQIDKADLTAIIASLDQPGTPASPSK